MSLGSSGFGDTYFGFSTDGEYVSTLTFADGVLASAAPFVTVGADLTLYIEALSQMFEPVFQLALL